MGKKPAAKEKKQEKSNGAAGNDFGRNVRLHKDQNNITEEFEEPAPVVVEKESRQFQIGDSVLAKYVDEDKNEALLPGTVDRIERKFNSNFVNLTGYSAYEAEKFDI